MAQDRFLLRPDHPFSDPITGLPKLLFIHYRTPEETVTASLMLACRQTHPSPTALTANTACLTPTRITQIIKVK